ncbi:MAG: flagellar hook-length control protein FliK, partial [Lachnospiraceae bacterium]|nr:flagellar hook-length control protein FliK [Lachnospiraceae bacterium]
GGLAEGEIMADAGDGERPVEALSYGRQSEFSQKEDSGSQSSELDGSTNAYSQMFRTQNTESQWSRSGLEKAADTPVVRTTPETFGPDIGKTLAARIPEKNGTLTIELEPASLGKLTIRVIYEAGKAAVSIMADNPKTLELLNQNAAEIARIMEEKTGQETVIYTPEAQQQMGEKTDEQGKGRQNQEQEDSRKKEQSDAFAQQLRLGLV